MNAQYDSEGIARGYAQLVGTMLRNHVHDATFDYLIRKAKNDYSIALGQSSCLDLACGEGRYTRRLKELGAKKVAGADISNDLISIARKKEEENPLGIEYHVRDVTEPMNLGIFDLVTAWFLLHYAPSKEHLFAMCRNVYDSLNPGGLFIAYQSNPFGKQSRDNPQYGEFREVIGTEKEGADVKVILFKDGKKVSFIRKLWMPQTYQEAILEAGFSFEGWYNPVISDEAIAAKGISFWQDFISDPSTKAMICKKQ